MSRLTLTLVRITCDADNCTAAYPAEDWAPDASLAWREARRAGWERDFEQHRCPAHARSAQLVARVRELAAKGLPDGRIGERLGLTRGGVWSLRYRHGIAGQRTGRPSHRRALPATQDCEPRGGRPWLTTK